MKRGRLSLQVFLITLTLCLSHSQTRSPLVMQITVFIQKPWTIIPFFLLAYLLALFHFNLNQHFFVLVSQQLMEEKPYSSKSIPQLQSWPSRRQPAHRCSPEPTAPGSGCLPKAPHTHQRQLSSYMLRPLMQQTSFGVPLSDKFLMNVLMAEETAWKGQSWSQSQFFKRRDVPRLGLWTGDRAGALQPLGQEHHLTQTLLRATVRNQESCGESWLRRKQRSQQHTVHTIQPLEKTHNHQIKVCF